MAVSGPGERYVFLSPSNQFWGAERSLEGIVRTLAETSDAVLQVVTRSVQLQASLSTIAGVETTFVSSESGRIRTGLHFAWQALLAAPGSTLILFDLKIVPFIVALKPILRTQRKRLVLDVHDAPLRSQRLFRVIQMARFFDRSICVSRFAAAQIESCPADVVYRPVAAPVTRIADPIVRRGAQVGVIGRIDPEKHVLESIKIVAAVEGATLVLRGEPGIAKSGYFESVLEAGALTLGDRFVYEGRVDGDQALLGIDVLLFLNPREPSGRTIAEAQLLGIPVVGPTEGGASEFIEEGITGLKASVDNPEEVSAALRRLIADGALVERLRAGGRAHAERWYDANQQGRAYLNALRLAR